MKRRTNADRLAETKRDACGYLATIHRQMLAEHNTPAAHRIWGETLRYIADTLERFPSQQRRRWNSLAWAAVGTLDAMDEWHGVYWIHARGTTAELMRQYYKAEAWGKKPAAA